MKRLLVLLVLLLFSSGAAARTVLVFGDSLSSGYGLPLDKAWVSLLQARLATGLKPWRVVNASLSGETTAGGLPRLEPLLHREKPDIVILELGGNDGLRGLPPEQTRSNLDSMIRLGKRHGARVLLVGMQLPPNYGRAYTEKFRGLFPELAGKHKVALAPFLLEGIGENREFFQPDGIHPTVAAQPILLDNVWPHLKPLLK